MWNGKEFGPNAEAVILDYELQKVHYLHTSKAAFNFMVILSFVRLVRVIG